MRLEREMPYDLNGLNELSSLIFSAKNKKKSS
jgi:hypothetical protein